MEMVDRLGYLGVVTILLEDCVSRCGDLRLLDVGQLHLVQAFINEMKAGHVGTAVATAVGETIHSSTLDVEFVGDYRQPAAL